MIVRKGKPHTCKKPHPFQDGRYKGGRVANPLKKGEGWHRCTVCSEIFQVKVAVTPETA